jgi:purine-nucleoside phosphorylase
MTVFAFSLITNKCVTKYDDEDVANHEEVMEAGKNKKDVLMDFVCRMVQYIQETRGE